MAERLAGASRDAAAPTVRPAGGLPGGRQRGPGDAGRPLRQVADRTRPARRSVGAGVHHCDTRDDVRFLAVHEHANGALGPAPYPPDRLLPVQGRRLDLCIMRRGAPVATPSGTDGHAGMDAVGRCRQPIRPRLQLGRAAAFPGGMGESVEHGRTVQGRSGEAYSFRARVHPQSTTGLRAPEGPGLLRRD